MKKWIIKSNEWYDSLEEPLRYVIFVLLVGGGLTFCEVKMVSGNFYYLPIYLLSIFIWRISYIILKNL